MRAHPTSLRRKESLQRVIKAYHPFLFKASLTHSKDGSRRFGDHVMLFNGKV